MVPIITYVLSGIIALPLLTILMVGTVSIGHGLYMIARHKGVSSKYSMDMENLILHTVSLVPSMATLILDMILMALGIVMVTIDSDIIGSIRTIVSTLGYGTVLIMVTTNLFYHTKMVLNLKYPNDKDIMDLVIAIGYIMTVTTIVLPIIVVSVISIADDSLDTIMVVIYFIALVTINGIMAIAMLVVGAILISIVFSRIYRVPDAKGKKVPTLIKDIVLATDDITKRIHDSILRIFLVLIVVGTLLLVRIAFIIASYTTPYTYLLDNIGVIVDILMATINCLCYGIFLRYRFSNIVHMIIRRLS